MASKPKEALQLGANGDDDTNTQYINVLLHGVAEKARNPDAFIAEDERERYLNTLHHLLEGFSFPLSLPVQDGAEAQWKGMRSEIELLRNMGEIIIFVFKPQHGTFYLALEQAQKISCRLLGILAASGAWLDVAVEARDCVTPAALRNEILAALIQFLQGLGSTIQPLAGNGEEGNSDSLSIAKTIISAILGTIQKLVAGPGPDTYPLRIKMFEGETFPKDESDWLASSNGCRECQEIAILDTSHLACFMVSALEVLTAVSPATHGLRYLLGGGLLTLGSMLKSCFDRCMSPDWCLTADGCRSRLLSRLFELTWDPRPEIRKPLLYMQERLLHARLQGLLYEKITLVDNALKASFKEAPLQPSRALVFQAASYLDEREKDQAIESLASAYLQNCDFDMDPQLVPLLSEQLQEVLNLRQSSQPRVVNDLPAKETAQASQAPKASGKLNLRDHVWRRQVKQLVEDIIVPDAATWMEDDFRPHEVHTIRRVVDELSDRFSRPLSQSDAESRVKLANNVTKLPCLLAMCSGEDCCSVRIVGGSSLLPLYRPVINALLDGPPEEVTPRVRRAVYGALRAILHHRNVEKPDTHILDILFQGLVDNDRSTRIQAGYAVEAVTTVYATDTPASRAHAQALFGRLYEVLEYSKTPIKETTLICGGLLGRTSNPVILGHALCLLATQLGQGNIVVRSLACTQILSIAGFKKMPLYPVMAPHMTEVANLIFRSLSSRPMMLDEICRLICRTPEQFIRAQLPRAMPDIVVRGDIKALDLVANHLGEKREGLIVETNMTGTLAAAFLLPTPAQTNKTLKFIMDIFSEGLRREGLDPSNVTIANVVTGHTTTLLTELVVKMGEEDPQSAELSKAAIRKLEAALKSGDSRNIQGTNPAAFLAPQLLGIISRIMEMLQDIHGKKPPLAKQAIIRSLGSLISVLGPQIQVVSSQIMVIFQKNLSIPVLSEVTLESWRQFLVTVEPNDLGSHLSFTCATYISFWDVFSERSRKLVVESLQAAFTRFGRALLDYLDDIPDLSVIDELKPLQLHLSQLRPPLSPEETMDRILNRCKNSNVTIAALSLQELRRFMLSDDDGFTQSLAAGDAFDPLIGRIVATLFTAACREGEEVEPLRLVAYECLGILGAVDPYRFELPTEPTETIILKNFADDSENTKFVLHLISDLLVDKFRSTQDLEHQTQISYPIQELLKFCGFTPDLFQSGKSVPVKVRNRWANLREEVVTTVAPLIGGRYTLSAERQPKSTSPLYPSQTTYREWLQNWVAYLIHRVSRPEARKIFSVFAVVVTHGDAVIARHLLPHLVLHILISGDADDAQRIRTEISTVLEDQINANSTSPNDKKRLSAQLIFSLLDHLTQWIRVIRRQLTPSAKKTDSKRPRDPAFQAEVEEQLTRVDSIVSNLDLSLMANAALQCKAYARSLMSYEQQIVKIKEQKVERNMETYYSTMHHIYAQLDQPDGMEGVSSLIKSPNLEHQIREHESTGRWTSAQSCWELQLQQSSDNINHHIGLLRALRNLGHYDTLYNHVKGVLTKHPEWNAGLADFHLESSWMVGAWDDVEALTAAFQTDSPTHITAKVLLAMRRDDGDEVTGALAAARNNIGQLITAAGRNGYVRSYDAILQLHQIRELEMIHQATRSLPSSLRRRKPAMTALAVSLSARFERVQPTFRNLEPVLSMRRVGFSLMPGSSSRADLQSEVSRAWITSAKIARKACHWQAAYSAVLQSSKTGGPHHVIQSAKLEHVAGNPQHALNKLLMYMKEKGLSPDPTVVDLTDDEVDAEVKAKLYLLKARWMEESLRFDSSKVLDAYREVTGLDPNWESSHFYIGTYYDECYKEALAQVAKENQESELEYLKALKKSKPSKDSEDKRKERIAAKEKMDAERTSRLVLYTVRNYARAIRFGTKFIYQTVPRLLTVWLHCGEQPAVYCTDTFNKMNEFVANLVREAPTCKWYTAFPQISSRIGHPVDKVYSVLERLIGTILEEYPDQALWLFASVAKSKNKIRSRRGRAILEKLRQTPSTSKLPKLIADSVALTGELLHLCKYEDKTQRPKLSMSKDFPRLKAIVSSDILIPLQESLTAVLPSSSSAATTVFQPFPSGCPTFQEFNENITVMTTLAKPKKFSVIGNDGLEYLFLGKPNDDLRKDARLMDLNVVINRLLKSNSDARRRHLRIRTYGVVTLNEDSGIVQWVPNTVPIRPCLLKSYGARGVPQWNADLQTYTDECKRCKEDKDAAQVFIDKILPIFPPVFHEWFIEQFSEPTTWLECRLNYTRTIAVMSMVGYIIGLGDRHTENILLDVATGDCVHVDLNCLFDRGQTLAVPERVPFRLTQNLIDGFGVTGVEGAYRIACILAMKVLRENKDTLMAILDAFVHDPLLEWEEQAVKQEMKDRMKRTLNKNHGTVSLVDISSTALDKIRRKFEGYLSTYQPNYDYHKGSTPLSTENLAEALIHEASSARNLSRMYSGWSPWY